MKRKGLYILFIAAVCFLSAAQGDAWFRKAEKQQPDSSSKSLSAILQPGEKGDQSQTFTVLRIYDGDTIQVRGAGLTFKIRLVGIDAPETGYGKRKGQPFGRESGQYLDTLVKDESVRLKSYGSDRYNRQLAEVFVGEKNINLAMVRAGLAEVYQGKRAPGLNARPYFEAETAARESGTGMWVQGNSYTSPREWRRQNRSAQSSGTVKKTDLINRCLDWVKTIMRFVRALD